VVGNISSSVTYTDETVVVTGSLTGGTITLNNSTLIVQGAASGGATVNMQSGINTLDLAHVSTSASGNPTVNGFSSGDSIGLGTGFTNVTIQHDGQGNATATFKAGSTTVGVLAIPHDNDLSGGFYSTTATETLAGTTYTVATLDPGTGATGGPPSTPIQPNTLLGGFGATLKGFLQSTVGGTSDPSGQGQGNQQGTKQLLANLTTDLTNFGSLVNALKPSNDPSAGANTQTPQNTGVGAFSNLDQGGKPDLNLPKPDVQKH
jgi:hypothetical protein